jgi:hypothetical protein
MTRGRKAFDINDNIGGDTFTMADLCRINPGINRTTINAHVVRSRKSGKYVEVSRVKTGTRGKPAIEYTKSVNIPVTVVDESETDVIPIPVETEKPKAVKQPGLNSDVMSRLRFLTTS